MSLLVALMATAQKVQACDAPTYDPTRTLRSLSPAEIAVEPEVIVEGVIEAYTPTDTSTDVQSPPTATSASTRSGKAMWHRTCF
jgi:hypothetical protein